MIFDKYIDKPSEIAKCTYAAFVAIMFGWIIAWFFIIQIDKIVGQTVLGCFTFWTIAKILIWMLPALWLIKLSGRDLNHVLNVSSYKKWLLWGVGLGSCVALVGVAWNYVNGNPIYPNQADCGLVDMLLIAPVFDGFLLA